MVLANRTRIAVNEAKYRRALGTIFAVWLIKSTRSIYLGVFLLLASRQYGECANAEGN
jgi:hypothetical protein